MKLAHAQSMNIVKKGLQAIEVDFLARKLERMLHSIVTMQNLPHMRSPQVRMSDLDRATVYVMSKLHVSRTHPSRHTTKISSENPVTMQELPYLRSAQVRMCDREHAPLILWFGDGYETGSIDCCNENVADKKISYPERVFK